MEMLFSRGRPWLLAVAIVAVVGLVAACGGDDDEGAATATEGAAPSPGGIPVDVGRNDKANLTGAGATFPAPVYQAWFDDYNATVAKGVKVNYQAVGSGGGIQQFTEKTVEFGATDAPMTDQELQAAPDAQHLPTVIGAVVLTYNLSGVDAPLKLDGPTIAKIFLGQVKKWDDAAIAGLNPGVKLPDDDIQVVHRSDSSGTTFVFTDYLSKVSADWKSAIGTNKSPNWPVGQGGKGNDGVTGVVKNTPNSIGYVELNYALANKLAFADIKNSAGKFVTATVDSASAAAAGVTIPDDYRVSITDASGDAAYPIASFTYLLLHKSSGECSDQTPLVDMLWWVYHSDNARATTEELNYSPLPQALLPRIETTLKSLTCSGGTQSLKTSQ